MPRVDSKKNRKKTRGIQLLWGKEHVGPGVWRDIADEASAVIENQNHQEWDHAHGSTIHVPCLSMFHVKMAGIPSIYSALENLIYEIASHQSSTRSSRRLQQLPSPENAAAAFGRDFCDSGETWNENFDHPEGWIFMHHENHGRPGFWRIFSMKVLEVEISTCLNIVQKPKWHLSILSIFAHVFCLFLFPESIEGPKITTGHCWKGSLASEKLPPQTLS